MKKRLLGTMTLILAAGLLIGCAAKQKAEVATEPEPAQDQALLLSYQMPADGLLKYRLTVEQRHSMEMMRQPQSFSTKKVLEFSLLPGEADSEGMPLTVTVDSLHLTLHTPRGDFDKDIRELLGKSFNMALSPSGEESSFSMVEAVQYEMQPAGAMNVSTDLEAFFPNLPEKTLIMGEGWRLNDYLPDTAFNSGQKINMEITSILEGFETVDDIECARISTTMNGVLEQVGERMVNAPDMTGEFDGRGTWFFDTERGLLVKAEMQIEGRGQMETGGGHGPPANVRQTMKLTTELLP